MSTTERIVSRVFWSVLVSIFAAAAGLPPAVVLIAGALALFIAVIEPLGEL